MTEYSQGIAGDGPCILKNGQSMTPDEIVSQLTVLYCENKDLHEQVAALQSKEVCNLPHDDNVLEGCPYCRLEAALYVVNSVSEGQDQCKHDKGHAMSGGMTFCQECGAELL